jgi:hypothetical protein
MPGPGWLALLLLFVSPPKSPGDHVSFLVMGKTTNHRESSSGELKLLNYHFFAEIFPRSAGEVTDATLAFPGGEVRPFEDLGAVLEVHGKRFDDEAELDHLYPNGSYLFRFSTPSGTIDGRSLRVERTGEGRSRIPPPAQLTLLQGGAEISPDAVDPSRELTVRWSPFATGRADPNGIVDDLIFVVLGDCRGEKTVHSGRPFEGTPFLTYATSEYVFPRGKLRPGEPHQMSVEHAVVDTSRADGIVGLVTYASTTFLDFRTTGTSSGPPCPAVMPRIDAGQTDRAPGVANR